MPPIHQRRFGRAFFVAGVASFVAGVVPLIPGCLNRPVVPSDPQTSNQFVEQVRNQPVTKIDLLFVVDNSISMKDKQTILQTAVPDMLQRLVNPPCIDATTGTREPALEGSDPACREGFTREYEPVKDIHIGVISSSLGGHGGSACPVDPKFHNDDRGLLIPKVRPDLPSWNDSGFLLWDARAEYSPPGYGPGQVANMIKDFQSIIAAVDDNGCGYESTLEAWYRFLIDPEPPLGVRTDGSSPGVPEGIDEEVLRQRAAFLRPDSLVAIVMLSDEDDCSVRDDDYGWLMASDLATRPRGSSACAADPLSPCCRPCTSRESAPPDGCAPLATDPACASPSYPASADPAGPPEDRRNLRCHDQKRRFGMEFLYPTSRYVAGLTEPKVPNRAGELVPNPLFSGELGLARPTSNVLLAGIVGVPWQDVATPTSIDGPGLEYMTAAELRAAGRWATVLGDPDNPDPAQRLPLDPLMLASPDPRSGTHPLLGAPLGAPTSLDPQENAINGHEYLNTDNTDLQYACIFPLEEPFTCTEAGCDCSAEDAARNRPLCQPPGGGAAGPTQYFAKAYPARRHLEVLSGIGDSAVVASICPKHTQTAPTDPSYGYNPAISALTGTIIERFARCLPRSLEVESDGALPCRVAEATLSPSCDCGALPARSAPSAEIDRAVREELVKGGFCSGSTGRSCAGFCVCEIAQASGTSLDACQNERTTEGAEPGYCYIDATRTGEDGLPAPLGNPELVQGCPASSRRQLRFVGEDTPLPGAVTFIACAGATVSGE